MRQVLVFCYSFLISFNLLAEVSYLDSSREYLLPAFEQLSIHLDQIRDDSDPADAKEPRKKLGNFKLLLDFYIFAYPIKPSEKRDKWISLRELIDDGYTILGDFKDLYDARVVLGEIEVDEDKVEKRRAKTLKWIESFNQQKDERNYEKFLSNPKRKSLANRVAAEHTKYFWGAVKSRPKKNDALGKSLHRLLKDLVKSAQDDYKAVIKVKDLFVDENEQLFHDFRKKIRSIIKLYEFFPIELNYAEEIQDILVKLDELKSRYGDINDKLVGWHNEERSKKKKKIEKVVKSEWKVLRQWQKENDFAEILKKMI